MQEEGLAGPSPSTHQLWGVLETSITSVTLRGQNLPGGDGWAGLVLSVLISPSPFKQPLLTQQDMAGVGTATSPVQVLASPLEGRGSREHWWHPPEPRGRALTAQHTPHLVTKTTGKTKPLQQLF